MRVFSYGPQIQAPRGPIENEGGRGHDRHGQIDQGELVEKNRTQHGDVRESGQGESFKRADLRQAGGLAEDQPVEEKRQPRAEQGQADAGNVLAEPEADRQETHQRPGHHPDQHRGQHTQPEASREKGG